MTGLDWAVLAGSLALMVAVGTLQTRRSGTLDGYLLAGRELRWVSITLSIMATQARAITFLSTPGQAYVDGMRFVQFYFGLPLAMVVLAAVAVPAYHRLRVRTAYEFLEQRLDVKTRTLTAGLFLVQRGLAAGLTIFAPSLILSVTLGWDLYVTNAVIGVLVVVYTTTGGTRAVSRTQNLQVLIIVVGMAGAFIVALRSLPSGVGFLDAVKIAGEAGRLNAIDLSFSLSDRYSLWSGLIGGFFLALAYFGTDQSQVQRYLAGSSVTESRLGLLANGLFKVPMQFGILFLGAIVFAFYQLTPPPLFFNPVESQRARDSVLGQEYRALEHRHHQASAAQGRHLEGWLAAQRKGDAAAAANALGQARQAREEAAAARAAGIDLLGQASGSAPGTDTNYIFLGFVTTFLPAGLLGLVLAAVFAASMSSTAAELNALASTTVVDFFRRLVHPGASERTLVQVSRLATVFWGAVAVGFAEYANRLGSLVEAVNILGSLFYGTILGVFALAFLSPRVSGTAAFVAALAAEAAVVACFLLTPLSFLWYNVVGCLGTVAVGFLLSPVLPRRSNGNRSVEAG